MAIRNKDVPVARINIRIDPAVKARISKAAHILGQDMTEFTVSTLNEKACEVLEGNQQFELSEAENAAFFEILDGPVPDSSKRALDAVNRYRGMIESGELIA